MAQSQASANDADKHPVCLLQEILTRRGCAPRYEVQQICQKENKVLFICTVHFEERGQRFDAEAEGLNKKDARKNAAAILLQQLKHTDLVQVEEDELKAENIRTEALLNADKGDNPIGALQEVCIREKWSVPKYANGPIDASLYTVVCRVLGYEVAVKSPTKKTAKRLAALDMCMRLLEGAELSEASKTLLSRVCNYHGDSKGKEAEDAASGTEEKTKRDHADTDQGDVPKVDEQPTLKFPMRKSVGKILQQLREICPRAPTVDPIKMLAELAEEQNIKLNYINFGTGYNGKIQYLLKTGPDHIGVHQGTGATDEEARKDAAVNALQHIKIISTKLVIPK